MKSNTTTEAAPVQCGQHTPGPWMILESDPDHNQVRGQYGEWVCSCDGGRHRLTRDRYNARLIASAPELLAACKAALEDFSALAEATATNIEDQKCYPKLTAAIAKATK